MKPQGLVTCMILMENLISCEKQSETPDNWFSNFTRSHLASWFAGVLRQLLFANLRFDDKLGS